MRGTITTNEGREGDGADNQNRATKTQERFFVFFPPALLARARVVLLRCGCRAWGGRASVVNLDSRRRLLQPLSRRLLLALSRQAARHRRRRRRSASTPPTRQREGGGEESIIAMHVRKGNKPRQLRRGWKGRSESARARQVSHTPNPLDTTDVQQDGKSTEDRRRAHRIPDRPHPPSPPPPPPPPPTVSPPSPPLPATGLPTIISPARTFPSGLGRLRLLPPPRRAGPFLDSPSSS